MSDFVNEFEGRGRLMAAVVVALFEKATPEAEAEVKALMDGIDDDITEQEVKEITVALTYKKAIDFAEENIDDLVKVVKEVMAEKST